MTKSKFIALLLAVAAVYLATQQKGCVLPIPINYPASVQAVADGLKGYPQQAHALGEFYATLAELVKADAKIVTTGDFEMTHRKTLQAFVASTGYKGAPMVGDKIDASILEVMGTLDADVAIADKRAALVARLSEISQALARVN